jgi:hypothetical protein
MPTVTLTDTYVCRGKILLPGSHEVTDEQHKALQSVGAIPKAEASADSPRASRPSPTRLASGAVVRQTPDGVTPGDPVQRQSVTVTPLVPSAADRNTADPAAGLPPPMVHTETGEAVETEAETETGGETEAETETGGETEDDGEGGTEDNPESTPSAEQGTAPSASRSRPQRVTSRPRAPSSGE